MGNFTVLFCFSLQSSDPLELQIQEFRSLNQAANVEVERLNGLVKVLQDRLVCNKKC